MDMTPLHDDCAFLGEWPGVPIADQEGVLISEALGAKRAIILAHHGYLTAGASCEEATYLSVYLERAARMQIRAQAFGPLTPVDDALAREAHDYLLASHRARHLRLLGPPDARHPRPAGLSAVPFALFQGRRHDYACKAGGALAPPLRHGRAGQHDGHHHRVV